MFHCRLWVDPKNWQRDALRWIRNVQCAVGIELWEMCCGQRAVSGVLSSGGGSHDADIEVEQQSSWE